MWAVLRAVMGVMNAAHIVTAAAATFTSTAVLVALPRAPALPGECPHSVRVHASGIVLTTLPWRCLCICLS